MDQIKLDAVLREASDKRYDAEIQTHTLHKPVALLNRRTFIDVRHRLVTEQLFLHTPSFNIIEIGDVTLSWTPLLDSAPDGYITSAIILQ